MKVSLTGELTAACALAAALSVSGTGPAHSAPVSVPAAYQYALATGPLQCPHAEVTPELIAAQVWAESRWRTDAISPGGAEGPAQLLPTMFAVYGADDDGNGVASPFDIADAIGALVRLDCTTVTNLRAAGNPTDPVSIAAAYKGGLARVDDAAVRKDVGSMITTTVPAR